MPEFVQLVNRTKGNLKVTYDGRHFTLVPGPNTVPSYVVQPAKNQHRVMGTEDPGNPLAFETLVGVPGVDDCTPREQSKKLEAMDRSLLMDPRARKAKIVTNKRPYSRAAVASDDLPVGADFAADRA